MRAAPRGACKLAHRVWNYEANGNFLGTIKLSETLTLGQGGHTHSGSFTLNFYDPSGSFLIEVAGSVRENAFRLSDPMCCASQESRSNFFLWCLKSVQEQRTHHPVP